MTRGANPHANHFASKATPMTRPQLPIEFRAMSAGRAITLTVLNGRLIAALPRIRI